MEPVLRFELKLPRTRSQAAVSAALVLVMLVLVGSRWAAGHELLFVVGLLVAALVGVPLWLYWRWRHGRPQGPLFVELHPDRLRIPVSRHGHLELPLMRLETLQPLVTGGPLAVVRVGDGSRLHSLVLAQGDAAALHRGILERLAATAEGAERAKSLVERARRGGAALAIRPLATWATLSLLSFAFALEVVVLSRVEWISALVLMGANDPALVRDGQLYRLVTANLLHGGALHILLNAVSLHSLGGYVERLYGRLGFAAIFLGSAILGALASALTQTNLSLGASTAVFGMLGAAGWLHLRRGRTMPSGFLIPPSVWLYNLLTIVLLSVSIPEIDHAAHGGGLVGGFLVGALCAGAARELPLATARLGLRRALAYGLGALALVAVGWLLWDALGANSVRRGRVLEAHARHGGPAEVLNALAWDVATDRKATQGELEKAEAVARRSLEESPASGKAMVRDTVATLLYRQGRYEDAVREELAALAAQDSDIYLAQLARFLAARKEATPLAASGGPSSASASGQTRDGEARLRAQSPAEATFFLLAMDGSRIRGLVCVQVPQGESEKAVKVPWRWPAELRLALVGGPKERCRTIPFAPPVSDWP